MDEILKNNLLKLIIKIVNEDEDFKHKIDKEFNKHFKIKKSKLYTLLILNNPLMYQKNDIITLTQKEFIQKIHDFDFISNFKMNNKKYKNIKIKISKIK